MQSIHEALMPSHISAPSSSHGNKRRDAEPESSRQFQAHHSLSRSPPQYQSSPQKRRAFSPSRVFSGQLRPSFCTSASVQVPSACAICLGRYHHEIHKCSSDTLWSGAKAHCRRNEWGHLVNPGGTVICSNWQRPSSCTSPGAGHCHECSGCGKNNH